MTAETKIENQIALIEAKDLVSFDRDRADEFLKKLREQELSVIGDISTEKGRKELASRAYRIAKIKTEVDKQGAKLKEDAQKIVKAVDGERRRIFDDLEALQHEIRQPLTDWENADKSRIKGHEDVIAEIINLGNPPPESASYPVADIDTMLGRLGGLAQRDWQEFANRATLAINQTRDALTTLKARRVKEIADAAELARLKKAEDDRLQKEREDKIAADAKTEADNRAKAAEEGKERADWLTMYAEAEGHNNTLNVAAKAEKDKLAAAKKAEDDRIAAEAAATKREQDRQAAETKRLADEQAAREKDKAHRAKINNEILLALSEIHTGTQEEAKAIITAIAQGKIPHTKITY